MEKVWLKLKLFPSLTQNTLAIAAKAITLIFATGVIFFQDLALIFNDALQAETTSYILVVPFLLVYLVYRKRKMLKAVIPVDNHNEPNRTKRLPTIIGILLSITAMLIYWTGSYTFMPLEYHMFALPIFVSGLTLILFNPQTLRQLVFPIAFLILLTPPPAEILYSLGSTLSVISSQVSYNIVKISGIPSTLTTQYGSPIIQIVRSGGAAINFAVDIACSGIYSLIGFLIFGLFITYMVRHKPRKKLALFIIGFPIIYLLNILRITSILLIGYQYGEDLALQVFHLLGGTVLIFLGTLLLLLIAEKVLHIKLFTNQAPKCLDCNPKLTINHDFCFTCGKIQRLKTLQLTRTSIVKMVAIIIASLLLISIQAPVFALVEGPGQIINQTLGDEQSTTQLLPQIDGYRLDFVYRDRDFEETAQQDASILYAYQPLDETKETAWVTIEIGPRSSLHRWESCIFIYATQIGGTPLGTQIDRKDIQIQENPPVIARYFAFQWSETNVTQVVLYWYEASLFRINDALQQKNLKISIITYPYSEEQLTEADSLIPFAAAITSYWQPIKTLSVLTLLLSQNGMNLAVATSALIIGILIFYFLERRKRKRLNANAYKKLSTLNKQIIDTVFETERITTPTLHAISTMYKNRMGEPIEEEKLLHKISDAEKTGLIKGYIANNHDQPIRIWRTQFTTGKN